LHNNLASIAVMRCRCPNETMSASPPLMTEAKAVTFLLEHLGVIRQLEGDDIRSRRSMESIFNTLHEYQFSDKTLCQLVKANAIGIIMEAIRERSSSRRFIYQGIGALDEIVEDSEARSAHLMRSVGLEVFFDLIDRSPRPDSLLQILVMGLFAALANSMVGRELIAHYSDRVIPLALRIMEEYSESPEVFHATSCVLLAWGPPEADHKDRLIENVWYGLSIHDDEDAQDIGRQLLRALFGLNGEVL
jgi:hypothetical protein